MSMLRDALIIIVLMLLALGVADARLPQVGDKVRIATTDHGVSFEGTITDMGDGLICLSCTYYNPNYFFVEGERASNIPLDVCIGVGSIVGLTWI